MTKRRKTKSVPRAMDPTLEAIPWAIEFSNTALSEKNWKDYLRKWFGVTIETNEESVIEPVGTHHQGKQSPKWHFGGIFPTLAHINRTQQSIRETLETLADRGTVPRDVVERVNSYLMGLHGFKFHITSDFQGEYQTNSRTTAGPPGENSTSFLGIVGDLNEKTNAPPSINSKATACRQSTPSNGKGVQPQTLRLEPKTFDLRSLFYYRFSLFLISAAAQRVRKCKQCYGYFIQRFNHRKLYCSDLCRFRSHNRLRTPKKAAGRKRVAEALNPNPNVWWRKYEGESTPD